MRPPRAGAAPTASGHAGPSPAGPSPAGLGELYDAHAEALRRYARRIVGSRDAADDVVQEVFVRVWRSWSRLELGSGTRAYLYVATRARALDHLKRARRQAARPDPGGGAWGFVVPVSSDEEADERLAAERMARALERVMERLPPRQREAARLRVHDGLTAAEIAGQLGISPRTAEQHLGQAMRRLRAELPAAMAEDQMTLE